MNVHYFDTSYYNLKSFDPERLKPEDSTLLARTDEEAMQELANLWYKAVLRNRKGEFMAENFPRSFCPICGEPTSFGLEKPKRCSIRICSFCKVREDK